MGWGLNTVPTIIGFGLSVFFIALVFTRLLCRRLQRAGPQPLFELDLDPRIDVEQPQHRATGLEPVRVAEIPTAKFSRDTFSMEDAQCSICLGEYEEREVLRIMPKCGHSFHLVCIDTWLRKKSTCPVCRRSLKDLIWTDPGIVDLSRSHQWHLPGAENSERSRSVDWVRPNLSSPTIPPTIMPVEPETGR